MSFRFFKQVFNLNLNQYSICEWYHLCILFDTKYCALRVYTELKRTDTGWYTCKALGETGETSSSGALIVEPPTDPNVIFHRTPEPSTYPSPPSRPSVSDIRESSVRLSWKPNPNNGASVVSSFTVEYFSPETAEVSVQSKSSIRDVTSGNRTDMAVIISSCAISLNNAAQFVVLSPDIVESQAEVLQKHRTFWIWVRRLL